MQETEEIQVQSLNGEDPLEKEMAIHSRILVWKFPWTEVPGGLQTMGLQKSQTGLSTHIHIIIYIIYIYAHIHTYKYRFACKLYIYIYIYQHPSQKSLDVYSRK